MTAKTNKHPSVAVIVLNYNGKNLLEESLGSLSRQAYSNYQLYMADDGSTDNSIEFVKKKFSHVRVIRGPRNFGPAGISNYAVSKTKGEYVVLTSNDMNFDMNCVEVLVDTIIGDKTIGICSSVLVKNKKDLQSGQYLIDNAGIDMDVYGFIVPHAREKPFSQYSKDTKEIFASCGGSFIISRQTFNKIGGFDSSFFGLSDDVDLSWRVRLLGYKIVVNPRSFLYHHVSPTLGKIKRSKCRYLSERNILRMMLKNYSAWSLVKILPKYLVLEMMEMAFFLFLKRQPEMVLALIKAFFRNLINLPSTLKERAKVQKMRVVKDEEILKTISKKSFKLAMYKDV